MELAPHLAGRETDWAAAMKELFDAYGYRLIQGNIQKVLLSIAVWPPYLILSERVNLTFRRRLRV